MCQQPTLLSEPKANARIVRKEIFGPVAVIDTRKKCWQGHMIRSSGSASLHTKDPSRALRVATAFEVGTVIVNTDYGFHPTIPFGGFKGRRCQS